KRKILATYETETVLKTARRTFIDQAASMRPPPSVAQQFVREVAAEHLRGLERLWYRLERRDPEVARELLQLVERLGEKYQVDELDSKYDFTGRASMTVPEALQVKEELETIDRLLEQLREAQENAQIGLIDMDALARFADPGDVDELRALQQQIQDYLREMAERQGLEFTRDGYRLSPQAMRIFQSRLLEEIFADLQAARSGRHTGPIMGEGAVELPRTKSYEFGDSVTHMDVPQSMINAMLRQGAQREGGRVRLIPDDIEVHLTRNNPKCATVVILDMSGSMRYDGQYVNAKRMGLALDGLIRSEYAGDFLQFIEMYTFARVRHVSELPTLMPKPVTIYESVVRLKADLSDPNISELDIPPHFTNIQRALQLARQLLAVQDTPNRQIILLTDGLPTAHLEGEHLYLLYPPDRRTEQATMREAQLCQRENITMNIFLLPNWGQTEDDVQFAHRMAETTRGRVFFTGGRDLDRYVVWDYVRQRRRIIG
ncbi:MAG: vWA domain-containing protein, partial [Planctomycetota bacterium]